MTKGCIALLCFMFAGGAQAVVFQFVTNEGSIFGTGFMDAPETPVDGHLVVADGTYEIGPPTNYSYQVGVLDFHAPFFSSQFPPSSAYMIYAQNLSVTVKSGVLTDFHGFFGWTQDPALVSVQGALTLNSDFTYSYMDKESGNFPGFDIRSAGRVEVLGIPVAAIPEAGTLPLIAIGVVAIVTATRRRSGRLGARH